MTGDKEQPYLRQNLLSDGHGIPVIWIARDRIQGLNEPAKTLFGYDPVGREVSAVLDERSTKKVERLASSLQTAARAELQIERPGAPPNAASFAVIRDGNVGLVLIGTSQGATYPEKAGEQLLSAVQDLAASLRRMGREVRDAKAAKESLEKIESLREVFVAALAHDLRSPLNAILLAEQVLETAACGDSVEDMTWHRKLVERNVRLALEIVDSVVSATRLDAARPALSTEKVQLGEVARRWRDALASVASSAEVSLSLIEEGLTDVRGDPVRLGEVFSNLLSNAIRHSPPGGRVTVEMSERGEELLCCVADQGGGIPSTMRDTLFEKFSQGDSATGVSGLGLYICRRIVELHGGRIWVEDNEPRGSRFVFALPLLRNDDA